MQKVPDAGFAIEGLKIVGIQRRLTLRNLSFPFKVISTVAKARNILRQFRPDSVIGFGGYASAPVMMAAATMGIPSLIQEQNSYAGLTNKLLGKWAKKICVAYEGMDRYFPAKKIVLTGNPVRKDIMDLQGRQEEGRHHFGLDLNKKTVLVLGGSLGARTINNCIIEGVKAFFDADVQVLWQTGKIYYKEMAGKLSDYGDQEHIVLREFITAMHLAYAAADVVISRAGALSVSELCLAQKPVVFVPSPNVAEDHQTKNALALVNRQAALMVRDTEAGKALVEQVIALVDDQKMTATLSENIGRMARPSATENIVKEIMTLV